jgi:hypothetical protein
MAGVQLGGMIERERELERLEIGETTDSVDSPRLHICFRKECANELVPKSE